jgi:hypothetical protein
VSLNNTQKPSQVFWKHSIIYLAGWMYEELILPSYFRSTSSPLLKLPVHCLLEHSLKPRQHFYLKSQGYSEYESSCYPQLDLLVANCVRIWGNKKSVPHLEVYSLSILQHLRLVLFSWLHLKNLTNSPQQKAWGSSVDHGSLWFSANPNAHHYHVHTCLLLVDSFRQTATVYIHTPLSFRYSSVLQSNPIYTSVF